jgi:hypothetical protein
MIPMDDNGFILGRKKTASIGYSITIEPLPASDRQSGTRVAKAYDPLQWSPFEVSLS